METESTFGLLLHVLNFGECHLLHRGALDQYFFAFTLWMLIDQTTRFGIIRSLTLFFALLLAVGIVQRVFVDVTESDHFNLIFVVIAAVSRH